MKKLVLIAILFFYTIVSYGQGIVRQIKHQSLLDLVANDTLNSSNTTLHYYQLNLSKGLISRSLGDSMEIRSLKYNGKTIIAEALINGELACIVSNNNEQDDYYAEQIFLFREEKDLSKSIALSASSYAQEEPSLPTNSARDLISYINYNKNYSTIELELTFMPIDGFSTYINLHSIFINNLTTTVYKINDWNSLPRWEDVIIVNPNTIIESPSILNVYVPDIQIKTYALLQIFLWPEFYGISLDKDKFDLVESYKEAKTPPFHRSSFSGGIQKDLLEDEDAEDEIFNFAVVENKPIFPGCENLATEDEKFMCFNQNIMQHIGKKFEFPELARQMGIQGKVYVNFVIEKNGKVSNVTIARGVDKLIDDEAIRVIKLLPKFTPAKQRGKPVRMQYTVPINARLE
jgi:TonB family protein